ncbi:hypothetical protein M0804_006877 [Polistes exclamans]|nr:hypothetical protein M0804_006877 [Polistes exclamans]
MRQVVVLEPAGSVLVIRQTSLSNSGGGGGVTGASNVNLSANNNGHDGHTLANHVSVSSNACNDHNQNRIVVVRSSSTCMTTTVDENTSNNGNGNINVNANINGNSTGSINCKTSATVGLGGVSKSVERNDHKNQEGIVVGGGTTASAGAVGESNSGCRIRTSKDAVHESVTIERKFDGADPISVLAQVPQDLDELQQFIENTHFKAWWTPILGFLL